ncbi:hypothetical protein QLQ12_01100 [Actinoplanes sp. NEAU-A12]|uniref:Uncharacterized protein n=1 Tax=Actinoplanes sandaracinus TaxID=3045177 RepID=A0ABT6WBT7_9ACTN|nr:hypothetical protein [Actinoplanes sandaracinus]MDI6097206.1 hypothetical protein [Actinoplanes sandaracinus]
MSESESNGTAYAASGARDKCDLSRNVKSREFCHESSSVRSTDEPAMIDNDGPVECSLAEKKLDDDCHDISITQVINCRESRSH